MKDSAQPKFTVLIVDDSKELLDVLRIVLEKNGHEVITGNDPSTISQLVQENRIDLLLLDVILPDCNGKDVCKELKSNPLTNYFPVLLMSVTSDYLEDFKDYDADGFIEKPFDLSSLIQEINACLHKEPAT